MRSEAKQARPELLALNALVGARQHILSARKGAQYPKLNGDAAARWSARPTPATSRPRDDWHDTYEAGVTLSWSPNDFALRAHPGHRRRDRSQDGLRGQRAFEQGIVVGVRRRGRGTSLRSRADLIERTQALEAARRYEADQRALLLAGAATPNDVLLAQRDLLAASLDWLNAFIAGRVAQAALAEGPGSRLA